MPKNTIVLEKIATKEFLLANAQVQNGDYFSALYQLLMDTSISEKRLKDLGIGDAGASYNPHFLLDGDNQRTNWLVKRFRYNNWHKPDKIMHKNQEQHMLFEQYFSRFVPETTFITLDRNFDEDPQYQKGKEYVVFQEYIKGITLKDAATKYGGNIPNWLKKELIEFIDSYRKILREEGVIPECYDVEEDQCIIDEEKQRLFLLDTNTPTYMRSLDQNELFRRYYQGKIEEVTPNVVHDVLQKICDDYDFDPSKWYQYFDKLDIKEARDIERLTKHFPRDYKDNEYLSSLINTFGLYEIANSQES